MGRDKIEKAIIAHAATGAVEELVWVLDVRVLCGDTFSNGACGF